jgi:hypothetical protein
MARRLEDQLARPIDDLVWRWLPPVAGEGARLAIAIASFLLLSNLMLEGKKVLMGMA